MTREPVTRDVVVDGKRLETVCYDGDPTRAAIVMLHEGLGSISQWRDLPQRLFERTRCTVVAYSRYGYGRSDVLREKRKPSYMHHEGEVVLPALLRELGIERPILFGHSDGASIALIYAGAYPDAVSALVLEAPHVFVEDLSVRSIAEAKTAYATSDLPAKLGRHHVAPDATFAGWNDIWLDPRFRAWNIESYADRARMPVLLIQGDADEYGTTAQLDAIAARIPGTRTLMVPGAGHSPHRDAPDVVIEGVAGFVDALGTMTQGKGAVRDVTVDELNASFQGDVYGDRPSMDAATFRAHVERNGVDLARSKRWTIDGALSGIVLLAFRGRRAWVGGFGVVPEYRGRGLARRYLAETLAIASDAGAASVELEVLVHNLPAIRLYERAGFERIDELVVWTREPLRPAVESDAAPVLRAYDAAAVAALARTPASCWQREPESVAAAAPFETVVVGADASPDAYAFVRRGERASLVDARAHDVAAASALVAALDARFGADRTALVNEPAHGALHDALVAHPDWHEFGRQHRMRLALR